MIVSKMRNVFLSLNFLEEFISNWYYFFLKCLVEFTSKSIWASSFLCEKVFLFLNFIYSFIAVLGLHYFVRAIL